MSSCPTEIVNTPQGTPKIAGLRRALEEDPEILEQARISTKRVSCARTVLFEDCSVRVRVASQTYHLGVKR